MIGTEGKNDESGEEQEDGYKNKGRKQFDEPEDAKIFCASGKVSSEIGVDMRCVISFNYLKVPAGPLLHECSHECACETEYEAEEPDRVDEYHRSGGGEGSGWTGGGTGTVGVGKLFGYLGEEELGGDIGILLQGRVADGNESCYRRREKTSLEMVRACKHTTVCVKAYENEDAICASLPIFHIFIVKLQCASDIHRKDSSRRVTISSFLRGGAIIASAL